MVEIMAFGRVEEATGTTVNAETAELVIPGV